MIVNFYDIDWDMSDDEPDAHIMPPTATTLTVEDGLDVENEGADILSDTYGWCVNGFNFDILEG